MQNDLDKTFGEIFANNSAALRDQLIEIQHHQASREESLQWVRRMRFLDISSVPLLALRNAGRNARSSTASDRAYPVAGSAIKPTITIPIIEELIEDDDPPEYLAVSWTWASEEDHALYDVDVAEYFKYYIARPNEPAHQSSFPDSYMDRVIKLAQSLGLHKIWIDRECIYQREGDDEKYPRDKELGVQVMDLVYQRAAKAVGLLTTSLIHQHEVDSLAKLLSGDIFNPKHTNRFILRSDTNASEIQMLILQILHDPRWSRAWIFQEDHLASYRMDLLIACPETIRENKFYDFGNVNRELHFGVAQFRDAVTTFCLAHETDRWPSEEFLLKAKRYKTYNTFYNRRESTTTYAVLVDICHRSIKLEQDRIPLLANALRFSKRLDTSDTSPLIRDKKYSLSTALLASILLNGEILHDDPNDEILVPIMKHTLLSYLYIVEFFFGPPDYRNDQYFIDHCRFKSPQITQDGLRTQGWLFKANRNNARNSPNDSTHSIRLTEHERRSLTHFFTHNSSSVREPGSLFNEMEQEVVEIIHSKLKRTWPTCPLADTMLHKLSLDRTSSSRSRHVPATVIFLKMMHAVVHAVLDDREVLPARFLSQPDTSPPSALFISENEDPDVDEEHRKPPYLLVFTSWDNDPAIPKSERLASLEVTARDHKGKMLGYSEMDDRSVLRTQRWINGVWDVSGKRMGSYLFTMLGMQDEVGGDDARKRKRGMENVGEML